MEEEYKAISFERLVDLLKSEACLEALAATGVDNWEGYDIAMSELSNDLDAEMREAASNYEDVGMLVKDMI